MSDFAKQHVCPSSAVLSAYAAGRISFLARRIVADHLAACEFCGAESAFWLASRANHDAAAQETHEPRDAAAAAVVATRPMPLAVRLLAESVLGKMPSAVESCAA